MTSNPKIPQENIAEKLQAEWTALEHDFQIRGQMQLRFNEDIKKLDGSIGLRRAKIATLVTLLQQAEAPII